MTTAPNSATAMRTSSREKPRSLRMAQNVVSCRSEACVSSVGTTSSAGPPLIVTLPVSGETSSVSVSSSSSESPMRSWIDARSVRPPGQK